VDTSTIQKLVQQAWTVGPLGGNGELLSESVSYGCTACGMGFGGWEATATHCNTVHTPGGIAASNGVPSDATSVSTFHAVELESPDE
jgi:hypothetical protein